MRPLPGPLRVLSPFPFVGRANERAALRDLLDAKRGGAALLGGEPGSGKSRLVRELAREAADAGAIVLYGACDPSVRTPYRPFVEALDAFVATSAGTELDQDIAPFGGELARLLPSAAALVGEAPPQGSTDPDTDRHRLHVAVAGFLAAVGARAPVVLVLEDLHWADAASLLLFRHLVRSGGAAPVMVLSTFRDAAVDISVELSDALVDVRRTDGAVRLRLDGLSTSEIAVLVEAAAGATPKADLTAAIEGLTGGNAFLVTELWRELVDTQAVTVQAGVVTLTRPLDALGTPEGVREVVSQRLARLTPEARELLEIGAVIGPEFGLALVRLASGMQQPALLDAVDEGVRNGLLGEVPAHRLAYRFTHELVRRALSDRLPAARRAELHLRVADALEQTAGAGGERIAALAHHFAEASPLGATARAVDYNLRAGRAAEAALAFDEAAERFDTALGLGIADPGERARALLELGGARHRAGHLDEALAAFRQTAELARELGDTELLALAAAGFEEACWRPGIVDAGAAELLEEAAAKLDDNSPNRVRVLGCLARARDFRGEFAAAAVARDTAIALARERADRTALGWVLAAAYWSRGVSASILRKTSCANRTEAAAYALRMGLAST